MSTAIVIFNKTKLFINRTKEDFHRRKLCSFATVLIIRTVSKQVNELFPTSQRHINRTAC